MNEVLVAGRGGQQVLQALLQRKYLRIEQHFDGQLLCRVLYQELWGRWEGERSECRGEGGVQGRSGMECEKYRVEIGIGRDAEGTGMGKAR